MVNVDFLRIKFTRCRSLLFNRVHTDLGLCVDDVKPLRGVVPGRTGAHRVIYRPFTGNRWGSESTGNSNTGVLYSLGEGDIDIVFV